NAEADITVVVTSRDLIGENQTNTVYAKLTAAGAAAELIGQDEGMWRPAATDLAKNIAAWVINHERTIRDCINDPRNPKCGSAVDRGADRTATVKKTEAVDPQASRDAVARAVQ